MIDNSYMKDFVNSGHTSGSVRIPENAIPKQAGFTVNPIDQGLRTQPIPFSDEVASIAQQAIISALESDDPLQYIFDENVVTIFGNEIKRFLVALEAYLTSPNPLLSRTYLVQGIVFHNFAHTLKKIRVACLTRKFNAVADQDDGLDPYVVHNYSEIEDVGDVFNYKYWLHWEEPEPEDWKLGLEPVNEPSDAVKSLWEDSFREVLPKSVPEVPREEVLFSTSSSVCYTEAGSKSKVYLDKSDPKKNYFSSRPLRGWRLLIRKGPTEVRDAVTLPISQSNTVKWIEKQCAAVCANTRYSAYGKSDDEFEELTHRFYQPGGRYYNRDLTKEGIAKPRWLLKSMGKVLKEMYPHMAVWDYFSIFDGYSLNVKGEWYSMKRGHGLGMANALTTLMQCATFEYLKKRLDEDIFGTFDALFYNDDATIKSQSEESILSYSDGESDLIKELGLLPKASKTYSSPMMILCERYFPIEFSRKRSYERYVRRLGFAATNILTAKSYFSLVDDPAMGDFEPGLVGRLINFWGCESSPEEYSLPSFAGGWRNIKLKGVQLDFLTGFKESQTLYRGMRVGPVRTKPDNFSRVDGVWHHPIEGHIHFPLSDLDSRVHDMLMINQPLSRVMAKYHKSTNDEQTHKFLRRELLRRWNIWQTPAKPMSIAEIYHKVVNDNPYVDYLPPKECRVTVPLGRVADSLDRRPRPPIQPCKNLASLGWFTKNMWINKVINYPYLEGDSSFYKLSGARLEAFKESLLGISESVFSLPESDLNINCVLKVRNYCDDYNALEAWAMFNGEDWKEDYPIPTVKSLGGVLKSEAQDYLFLIERAGRQDHWDFYVRHGRTLVWLLMFGTTLTNEDWDEIWKTANTDDEIIDEAAPFIVDKVNPETIEDDYKTFWDWRLTDRQGAPPHFEHIYRKVDECISSYLVFKGMHERSEKRLTEPPNPLICAGVPEEGSALAILYEHVTKVPRIEYCGCSCYGIPNTLDDVLGSDSDEVGGAFGGMFD